MLFRHLVLILVAPLFCFTMQTVIWFLLKSIFMLVLYTTAYLWWGAKPYDDKLPAGCGGCVLMISISAHILPTFDNNHPQRKELSLLRDSVQCRYSLPCFQCQTWQWWSNSKFQFSLQISCWRNLISGATVHKQSHAGSVHSRVHASFHRHPNKLFNHSACVCTCIYTCMIMP